MSNAWILVSDAARARLFTCDGTEKSLAEIACFTESDGRRPMGFPFGHALPRTQESGSPTRHAIEPRTSWRTKAAQAFGRSLCAMLEDARSHKQFDQFFLVAPPRFLGVLHACMPYALAERLTGEISHDLILLPVRELHDRLHANFPRSFAEPSPRARQ